MPVFRAQSTHWRLSCERQSVPLQVWGAGVISSRVGPEAFAPSPLLESFLMTADAD